MSYDSREQSTYQGTPWEAYWFSCGPLNWRWTSGDIPRVVGGFEFTPEPVTRTEIDQNQELRSGSITITLSPDNPVAALFRRYLPAQPVSLVIYRGHDGEAETVCNFTGKVASVTWKDLPELTLVPEQDALKKKVPALRYQTQCPRALYSTGCKVNKTDYQVLATLTSVSGVTIKAAAFATKPNGYFAGGWVDARNTSMAVVKHVGDTLTLFFPLEGLTAGEIIVGFPGCDGTESTCSGKFSNIVNHLGFARIPTRNPFGDGGIR